MLRIMQAILKKIVADPHNRRKDKLSHSMLRDADKIIQENL